jgi:hypothetical protein
MPMFRIRGKVIRTSDAGTETIAEGSIIKEAESAMALKAAWEADMRKCFQDGPDSTVDFFAHVEAIPTPE